MLKKLLISFSILLLAAAPLSESSAQVRNKRTSYRGMTYAHDSTQDLQDLRAIGANVVMYQLVVPNIDGASIETYRAALATKLEKVDALVEVAGQIGLPMVLSLFSPPGGQGSTGVPPLHNMFVSKAYQDEFVATWLSLAERYKGKPGVLGFDLLNEPQQKGTPPAGVQTWKQIVPDLVTAIHAIDPERTIFIQPPFGNADLIKSKTPFIKDPRVIYNIHAYYPSNFRNQGLKGRPINVVYPKKRLNRAMLEKKLNKVIRYQKKKKMRIIVGEFAAPRWAPKNSSVRFLRDYIQIFQKHRWDWMLHAWREADVWSIEHSDDPNDPNPSAVKTKRQMLIEKFFKKNK